MRRKDGVEYREDIQSLILWHDGRSYEIALERCWDCASILQWIMQLRQKTWFTPMMLWNFIDELDKAHERKYGRSLHSLCSNQIEHGPMKNGLDLSEERDGWYAKRIGAR